MKIIVCGGRDFNDETFVFECLDKLNIQTPITELIQGEAKGADLLGKKWAILNNIKHIDVKANWTLYGKRAGYLRNCAMADLKPDLVCCFPGGIGTKMMKDISTSRNIKILEFKL